MPWKRQDGKILIQHERRSRIKNVNLRASLFERRDALFLSVFILVAKPGHLRYNESNQVTIGMRGEKDGEPENNR